MIYYNSSLKINKDLNNNNDSLMEDRTISLAISMQHSEFFQNPLDSKNCSILSTHIFIICFTVLFWWFHCSFLLFFYCFFVMNQLRSFRLLQVELQRAVSELHNSSKNWRTPPYDSQKQPSNLHKERPTQSQLRFTLV